MSLQVTDLEILQSNFKYSSNQLETTQYVNLYQICLHLILNSHKKKFFFDASKHLPSDQGIISQYIIKYSSSLGYI